MCYLAIAATPKSCASWNVADMVSVAEEWAPWECVVISGEEAGVDYNGECLTLGSTVILMFSFDIFLTVPISLSLWYLKVTVTCPYLSLTSERKTSNFRFSQLSTSFLFYLQHLLPFSQQDWAFHSYVRMVYYPLKWISFVSQCVTWCKEIFASQMISQFIKCKGTL